MSTYHTADAKKGIYRVLEETNYAYRVFCEWEHPNADYADYASQQSIADFRKAFDDDSLSRDDLCKILRRAADKARRRQCKTPWALFMANYLERNTNMNGRA
jgi:hypothetical protein